MCGPEGVIFWSNLHLFKKGRGTFSSEQESKAVLVDVLNAIKLLKGILSV